MILLFLLLSVLSVQLPVADLKGVEPQVAAKLQRLQQQVKAHPDSAEAWGKLAINFHAHDFLSESLPCYEEAQKRDPRNFHWIYYEAVALQEMNSPRAMELFQNSLRLKPEYAPAHLRLAQALFAAGRLDESAREFQRTIIYDARSADANAGLARIRLSTNDVEGARRFLVAALEANRDHAEAHGLLSEVYRRLNRTEEADHELLVAEQLPRKVPPPDPELNEFLNEGVSSYWYELRGRALLQQGKYDAAIEQLKKAAEVLLDPRFFDTIGIAYQYQKKYREAVEQHRKALALKPGSAGTLNNLAAAYAALAHYDDAIATLQKAIETEPDFAYSYSHLAGIQSANRQRSEAIATLRQGHLALPQNKEISLQLAWLIAVTPDQQAAACAEAVQLAQQISAKSDNKDAASLDVLAAAYAASGDLTKAKSIAEKAMDLSENSNLRKRIESHLACYKKGQPYRE